MEWRIVVGIAGRIIIIKISPDRLSLANSYSVSLRLLLREQYAKTLILIPMANGPMMVLDLLLYFAAIQDNSQCTTIVCAQ